MSKGRTEASFQDSGKCLDCSDLFIMLVVVITGSRASHLLTKQEGMGSSGHDFKAEC